MRQLSATGRVIAVTSTLCIVLLLIALVAVSWFKGGVAVIVVNKTGGVAEDVRLEFTGGVKAAVTLEPERSFRAFVQPKGESDLMLSFVDQSGNHHRRTLGLAQANLSR